MTITPSQRQWLARLAVLALLILIALAYLIGFQREPLHQTLADWTGEQDTGYQLRALGYGLLSAFQPARDTADFAAMPYTDLPPFGVNTFLEQEVEESKIRASLQLIHAAGFHFIRQEFPWEDIEQPGKGQFWDAKFSHATWDKYDRIVALARAYDLDLVVRLDHPPDWTRHDAHARGNFAPPDNFDDFGDFVAAVVTRYRGQIKYYQLWNEPNIFPEWGEQPVNAGDYVRLLRIGYARAKTADPNVVILSAGLAQTIETGPRNVSDLIFLQQMYDAGARGSFDILAVQDYGLFTGPGDRRVEAQRTNFSRPILIREIMVKNGDARKPIWAMEVGWNALPENFAAAPFGRVTETQQARYAVQAYQRAQEEWPWMGALMYWFFKRADTHETDQPFYYFRLLDADLTPHPAYQALKDYIARARFLGVGYHPSDHWAIDYGAPQGAGGWITQTSNRAAAGKYKIGEPGDQVRFTFHGNEVALALLRNPYSGVIEVRVDDGPVREIDLRATDPEANASIVIARGLPDGEHRAQLTVLRGQLFLDGVVVRRTNDWLLPWLGWGALGAAVIIGAGRARRHIFPFARRSSAKAERRPAQ